MEQCGLFTHINQGVSPALGQSYDQSHDCPNACEVSLDDTYNIPDSKVHGTNVWPIWGRQDPGGPHVGPMISWHQHSNTAKDEPRGQFVLHFISDYIFLKYISI